MSILTVQQRLKAAGFDPGRLDGEWGAKTDAALAAGLSQARAPQEALRRAGYYAGAIDGVWGGASRAALDRVIADALRVPGQPAPTAAPLARADIEAVARSFSVSPHIIAALVSVESGGAWFTDIRAEILDLDGPGGFIDGTALLKMLFEAHLFAQDTGDRFNASHPNISSPSWNRALYVGGQGEYRRWYVASTLDENAAFRSASWGMFQILGRNHRVCGYDTAKAFVMAMQESEGAQLRAFADFIRGNGLTAALQTISADPQSCRAFARGYNGPSYATHGYHTKIAAAVKRLAP